MAVFHISDKCKSFYFLNYELTKGICCVIISVLQKCTMIFRSLGRAQFRVFETKSHPGNIFRGVAKVVSRQFRVLETVGSSPAASTKKEGHSLRVSFFFCSSRCTDLTPATSVAWVRILHADRVAKWRESVRKQLSVVFPRA